jgi:hypothetical protein
MIAYEYLEKLLSARDEKGLENRDRGSQSDIVRPSWTLSGGVSGKILRFLNFLGIKSNFADMK